nr:hypothetical protein CcurKRNrm3_p072 [Cryptomonas curvata]
MTFIKKAPDCFIQNINRNSDFLKIIEILNISTFNISLHKSKKQLFIKIIYIKFIYIPHFLLNQNSFINIFKNNLFRRKIANKISIKEKLIFLRKILNQSIFKIKYKNNKLVKFRIKKST